MGPIEAEEAAWRAQYGRAQCCLERDEKRMHTEAQYSAHDLREAFGDGWKAAQSPAPQVAPSPIEQQAEAFRTLKRVWDSDKGVSDWFDFCRDFDWNEPQDTPSGKAGT